MKRENLYAQLTGRCSPELGATNSTLGEPCNGCKGQFKFSQRQSKLPEVGKGVRLKKEEQATLGGGCDEETGILAGGGGWAGDCRGGGVWAGGAEDEHAERVGGAEQVGDGLDGAGGGR